MDHSIIFSSMLLEYQGLLLGRYQSLGDHKVILGGVGGMSGLWL